MEPIRARRRGMGISRNGVPCPKGNGLCILPSFLHGAHFGDRRLATPTSALCLQRPMGRSSGNLQLVPGRQPPPSVNTCQISGRSLSMRCSIASNTV